MRPIETTADRSALMKRVRQKNTGLESAVRKVLYQLGARYRMNVQGLPGRPDIANRSRKKAIFIHGCFWHYHETCGRGRVPTRNREFWLEKLRRNVERDRRKDADLVELGYDVLILWGCEISDIESLRKRLHEFWFGDS
jgi:DNA mismatch endonuclease (patch repair protein)